MKSQAAPSASTKTNLQHNRSIAAVSAQNKSLAEAHAHFAAGVVLEQGGKPEDALAEYFQAAVLDSANETLVLEVSQRLLENKQPERALEILRSAADRPDASAMVLVRLGFTYVQLGRIDDSIAMNRRAIKQSPADLSGYQNLYLNLLQNDQRSEALKTLEQAAKVPDTDAGFLINLAELLLNYGRQVPAKNDDAKVAALAVLNRAAKTKPVGPALVLKLADGFNALGEDAPALSLYQQLLSDYVGSPALQNGVRARLLDVDLRIGDRKAAIVQLQIMLADDPANVTLLYQMADLAQQEDDFKLAEDSFRKVVLLRPDLEPPYYELAQAQISLTKSYEAIATLDQARQKFSASFVSEMLAGAAYNQLKDFDKAIGSLNHAEALARVSDPKQLNEGFYYQLGAIYERKGDLDQAEHYLRKSLELSPDFAEAQNYLGYMWADRGTNLDEARKLIEKAVRSDPQNAAFVDSLGWVLFKLKRPNEALPKLLKAVDLNKEPDATLLDHLGDIQFALGRSAQARESWKKSIALEPSLTIEKKLDSTPTK